jgi:hypothetical protein
METGVYTLVKELSLLSFDYDAMIGAKVWKELDGPQL